MAGNIRRRRTTLPRCATTQCPSGLLFWKLVRENFQLVDLWRFRKQITGLGLFHQGCRHLAVKMRVAPGLVVERVEDGEGGRPLLNGEPRDRARLSVRQGYGGTQKIRDLLLLARLRPQRNVQCKFCHHLLLLPMSASASMTYGAREVFLSQFAPAPGDQKVVISFSS